jgi:hypothetical protein
VEGASPLILALLCFGSPFPYFGSNQLLSLVCRARPGSSDLFAAAKFSAHLVFGCIFRSELFAARAASIFPAGLLASVWIHQASHVLWLHLGLLCRACLDFSLGSQERCDFLRISFSRQSWLRSTLSDGKSHHRSIRARLRFIPYRLHFLRPIQLRAGERWSHLSA